MSWCDACKGTRSLGSLISWCVAAGEEQKVNEAIGELSKLEAKKKHLLRQMRSKGEDIASAQREATAFRNQLRQQVLCELKSERTSIADIRYIFAAAVAAESAVSARVFFPTERCFVHCLDC